MIGRDAICNQYIPLKDELQVARGILKLIEKCGFGNAMREGNRGYFCKKLEESFLDIKEQYISTFGNDYEGRSSNHDYLC